MWPNFASMLSWWQWTILAMVPPAIIALYFLKLKRQPLEVPSTYLWHKSIEDLHVNSIWQRLRRNLLLLLQLLLVFLAMLALLRPSWKGMQLTGDRFIFLVDNSASMQATDVGKSRLDEVKRKVGELIGQMKTGDVAMVVSFADTARVEQTFTDDRRRLRRSLLEIRPTQRPTSLLEALKVASGLANPGRSADDVTDFQVADALPAKLFIFSDGKFDPVTGFALGNLDPVFVPIGDPDSSNVAIVAFSVRRKETLPDELQAFARLESFAAADVTVAVELFLDGRSIDADRLEIAAGENQAVTFDLGAVGSGVLKLVATTTNDDLTLDDEAWTVVDPPRRAKVLLVTPGNEPLEFALQTGSSLEIAEVAVESPEFLETEPYLAAAAGGAYDLVVYDRCGPQTMPQANTLFIGGLPPEGWSAEPKADVPQIIDTEAAHPLLQWMDLGDVVLVEGTALKPPPGGDVLIDTNAGPMLVVAPRERFEDVVLGFAIIDQQIGPDGAAEMYYGTNWPTRQSFPVFVRNVLSYLGGGSGTSSLGSVRPGKPVTLEDPAPQTKLGVRLPDGNTTYPEGWKAGKLSFTNTSSVGAYEVLSGGETLRHFAVNLFDSVESNIRPDPSPSIQIGYVKVAGQSGWEAARREIWKVLLLLGLAVLLLEWYIYNRRVYL